MPGPRLSTPLAIVIAGALVGLGLMIGLRRNAPQSASPGYRAPAAAGARPAAPEPEIVAQISGILNRQRPELARRCWEGKAAVKPPRWVFEFVFRGDGRQIARAVREEPGTGSAEITACLLAALEPVSVASSGSTVKVTVPFELP